MGFTSVLQKRANQSMQEAKQKALAAGLKDKQGNLLVSADTLKQHLLVNESEYQIIYQERGDIFIISLNATPFNDIRDKAEKRFLALTQASPTVVCKLNVKIVTPQWANPNFSYQTFPLSFCRNP